ncbi:alpha/beta fold hydrolase [Limnobacter sp.]|uniref:esterase/lipase family protein n=1 Tax=Limnobacter sp. TaxID=2003368 RepID=UPI0025883EDB|nr:alpha/beta fold hydrolase [Limnobacter sp.]
MTNTKPPVNEVGSAIEGGLKLAGDTFEQAASRVHEFHRAISDMPFKAVGTATLSSSKPIESVHNEITDLVYSAVKEVGKGVFNGAAWAVKQANQGLATQNRRPSRRVAAINSAINGLLGDHLSATRNPIEIKTGFYQDGHLLGLEQDELIQAFPDAKSSLVVFVHGLCCNEDSWFLYHKPEALHTVPYGPRLAHHFDVTPLYLRYNTGRSIEANARQFKRILTRLCKNWPVAIDHVILVGHSMGGLVSRALVEMFEPEDLLLQHALKDVVCLGSPHAGAPLARLAAAGEGLLDRFELSKPVSRVLGVRSTGIRDLQGGLGPLMTSDGHRVQFHLIGSTVGKSTGSWLNDTVGDGLVQMSSALADETGTAQRAAFSQKHHMQLLNDPEIYVQLEAVIRQHLKPI